MSWPCVDGYCVDWKAVAEAIGGMLSTTLACAAPSQAVKDDEVEVAEMDRPFWLYNPPPEHLIAESHCVVDASSYIAGETARMAAMGDAIRKRCRSLVTAGEKEVESRGTASIRGPQKSYSEKCKDDKGEIGLKVFFLYSFEDIICMP